MRTDAITEYEHDQIERYLALNGYESIEDWAVDSDYTETTNPGPTSWQDEFGNYVNLDAQLLAAIEASAPD
jgi:hypothetical protein